MEQKKTTAIVREVPDSYVDAVTLYSDTSNISVEGARVQHKAYCDVLQSLGLEVVVLPADVTLPDCCFTEDPAIAVPEVGIITYPGTPSRVAETTLMEDVLKKYRPLHHITPPGTLEGGDVMVIGMNVYVGISTRSNNQGYAQVRECLEPFGYLVHAVEVNNILHLKSACTYVGKNVLLFAEGYVSREAFGSYDLIEVPKEESYAANCLLVNDTVLVPEGYPRTREMIEGKGLRTVALEMSEFKIAEGSLTCLSLLL